MSWISRLGHRAAVYALPLVLLGCGREAGRQGGPASSSPVVAISMRGLSDGHLDRLLDDGTLGPQSAFARMAREGRRASHLIPVINAVTATNAATLETGVAPALHGIVGNSFRIPGSPFSQNASGFGTPYSAEAVWEAADRQGKRVVRVGTIMLHGSRQRHGRVKTLGQSGQVGRSRHVSLISAPASDGSSASPDDLDGFEYIRRLVLDPDSPDPLQLEALTQGTVRQVDLVAFAVDARRDGREQYEALVLDDDNSLANGFLVQVDAGAWAPLALGSSGSLRVGTWIKLLELTPEAGRARLYVRPPQRNRGYPVAFVRDVESAFGFPPGGPNWLSYFRGLIDDETVLEEIEREIEYVMDVSLFAIENEAFDLLQIDHSLVDRLGHAFYLTDSRQPGYGDDGGGKRERFARYLQDGYRTSDANLRRLLERLPRSAHVLVSSGYGFTPVHSSVGVHSILAEAGFRVFGDDGPDRSEVRVLSSKVSGHLYLSLEGREPQGVIPADQRPSYIDRVITALEAYRDPRSGEEVFQQVVPKSELAGLGLGHPQAAGDVWILMELGYAIHSASPYAPDIVSPSFLGEHGYHREHPEAYGILYYMGPADLSFPDPAESPMVGRVLSTLLGIDTN